MKHIVFKVGSKRNKENSINSAKHKSGRHEWGKWGAGGSDNRKRPLHDNLLCEEKDQRPRNQVSIKASGKTSLI